MALDPQQIQSSIAKAREAQEKFKETKAKIEAAKKKADAAAKRAKELQQQIKLLQAASKTPGGTKAGIAAIVAGQMGSLKGKIISQVQTEVISILNKFSSKCPNTKELQKIIKTRNTLINHLTSFEKRIGKYSGIASKLTTTVQTVNTAIKIITSIPIPTAVIPPGGGVGIPTSILTKYSNSLVKLNKTVDRLLGEAAAITGVVSTVNPVIVNLKNKLNSIDIAIEQCSLDQPADLVQILANAQPPENTGTEGTPTDAQGNVDPNYQYQGYTLAIVVDPNSPTIAPRRYAIALDRGGTVKLRGESSFSSDTQVLLDELKFKIDNRFI
jgi:hypothetical protein